MSNLLRRRPLLRPAMVPFVDPASLPGLSLWLDSNNITGLTDGAAVASWPDASGNNRHAAQATSSRQPLYRTAGVPLPNGRPVVAMDGSNDYLAGPYAAHAQPLTTFTVLGRVDTGTQYDLDMRADGAGTPGFLQRVGETVGNRLNLHAGVAVNAVATTATLEYSVTTVVWNNAASLFRVDRVSQGGPFNVGSINPGGGYVIGKRAGDLSGFGDQRYAAVVIYNRALTLAEVQQVEDWLAARYGTP